MFKAQSHNYTGKKYNVNSSNNRELLTIIIECLFQSGGHTQYHLQCLGEPHQGDRNGCTGTADFKLDIYLFFIFTKDAQLPTHDHLCQ